jgi:hypothetical protein
MPNLYAWINISIFYTHNKVHHLFETALPAFLSKLPPASVKDYILWLSKDRGENLQVFLEMNVRDLLFIEELVTKNIVGFIQANPSLEPDLQLPLESVLLPFPNNTIQYNIQYIMPYGPPTPEGYAAWVAAGSPSSSGGGSYKNYNMPYLDPTHNYQDNDYVAPIETFYNGVRYIYNGIAWVVNQF